MSLYYCKGCDKIMERDSDGKVHFSFCETAQKTITLKKVTIGQMCTKKSKKAMAEKSTDEHWVVIHKNAVYKNIFFDNVNQARNYIKMNNPLIKFKEQKENIFTCTRYGTVFRVMQLSHFQNRKDV